MAVFPSQRQGILTPLDRRRAARNPTCRFRWRPRLRSWSLCVIRRDARRDDDGQAGDVAGGRPMALVTTTR